MTSAGMILVKADDEGQGIATPVRRLTGPWLFMGLFLAILCGTLFAANAQAVESSMETTGLEEVHAVNSRFVTSASRVKSFRYTNETRSLVDAFKEAFPDDSWWNTTFAESPKPSKTYYWRDVVYWVKFNLLHSSPFEDGKVPIPFTKGGAQDQLEPGEFAGYTRRQVCFIAAKALTGARLDGYADGLTRYLSKEGAGGCLPRKGGFGKALWALLATCSADPMIQGDKQGPMLFVVKQRHVSPSEQELKREAEDVTLSDAGFRICRYEDGSVYKQGFLPGVPTSPPELCSQPSSVSGTDFLSTKAMHQAVVAPSDGWIGGKLFGGSCGPGGTLEQNLMMLMPEVAVLSFTLSQAKDRPQLLSPAWILGARPVMTGFDGTGHFMNAMRLDGGIRMKSDLDVVQLNNMPLLVSKSKPFVSVPIAFKESFADYSDMKHARQNRALPQRQVQGKNSLAEQVLAWYSALTLDAVPGPFKAIMPRIVRSLGTGPWISGSRFGDSQIDVLSMWIGQSLVSKSWGQNFLMDYYLYSYYHENPGNQCFLHAAERCGACFWTCKSKQFSAGSFYLPDPGFMSDDHNRPCVLWSEFACPTNGIENVFWNFGFKSTQRLWSTLETALGSHQGENTVTVFDRLIEEVSSEMHERLNPI